MSITPLTVPPKKLAQTISSSAMSFKLNNIKGWSGLNLVPADFGTEAYGVFMNSTRTQIEVFKFDPATIASASITILVRGLGYSGGDTAVPANQYPWASNDTVVQLGTDAPQLFRDFLSETNTATISAKHTYTELPESAVTPADDEDFVNKEYVDGLTKPAITVPVAQVGHAFVVGDVIRVSGVNTFVKAQADSAANAEVVGYVTEVVNVDNFKYVTEGQVTTGVPVYAAGTVLFLSAATAGALTDVPPSTIGQVQIPLGVIIESGVKMVFHKYRGILLNTISGNPIASETVAGIVEQATPAQVAAKTDVGETGAPLFVVPSLIPEGPTVLTLVPQPIAGIVDDVSNGVAISNDSIAHLALYSIPHKIVINKISVRLGTLFVAGNIVCAIYTENGATLVGSGSVAMVGAAVNTITLGSPLTLNPGNYYILFHTSGASASADLHFYQLSGIPFATSNGLNGDVSGEPVMFGNIAITASTTPATITPTAITKGTVGAPVLRIDN